MNAMPASGQKLCRNGVMTRAAAMSGAESRRKKPRRPKRADNPSGSRSLAMPTQYGTISAKMPSPPTAKPIQSADRPEWERSSGSSTTMIVCEAEAPSSPAVSAYCLSQPGVRVSTPLLVQDPRDELTHRLRVRTTARLRHHLSHEET